MRAYIIDLGFVYPCVGNHDDVGGELLGICVEEVHEMGRSNLFLALYEHLHVHRDVVTFWRGVPAYVTSSATFSNGLILRPVDDVDPLFEPPMCRLFLWRNERLTSHISFIGSYLYGLSEGVPKPPQNEQIDMN